MPEQKRKCAILSLIEGVTKNPEMVAPVLGPAYCPSCQLVATAVNDSNLFERFFGRARYSIDISRQLGGKTKSEKCVLGLRHLRISVG